MCLRFDTSASFTIRGAKFGGIDTGTVLQYCVQTSRSNSVEPVDTN